MSETKVKSLGKALKVLECFLDTPVLGVTDVSQRLCLFKSNASDILSSFRNMGYLIQEPDTGKYRLGYRILELSHAMSTAMGFRQTVYPYIKKLADELGETVYYGIPDGASILYLDAAYPQHDYATRTMLGIRVEMYCTGIGKALLSYIDEERWPELIPEKMIAYTETTITDRDTLYTELRTCRARGYAIDNMEHEYGVKCIGVPILSQHHEPVASISLSGPSLRFGDEQISAYAERLKITAKQVVVFF